MLVLISPINGSKFALILVVPSVVTRSPHGADRKRLLGTARLDKLRVSIGFQPGSVDSFEASEKREERA
jgi:hypothetical protein